MGSENVRPILVGFLCTLSAFILKATLDLGVDQNETPFLIFPAAILIAAWFSGPISGVAALASATIITLVYYVPPESLVLDHSYRLWSKLIIFLLEGSLICVLVGRMQRSQAEALRNEEIAVIAEREARDNLAVANETREKLDALQITYRTLVESNVIGVMICKTSGEIIEANDAVLRIVKYTREDLEQGELSWRTVTSEEYRERDEEALRELSETGKVAPYEKDYIAKDGTRRRVLVGAAKTTNPDEVVACVLDCTEAFRMKKELEQALVAAEAASRTKTEFLANISHELRTPLNAIIGMTDLALDEDISPSVEEYLSTSRESAETLLYLINDILDFSRMESGVFELDENPFHLYNLIDRTLKTLGVRAHQKGLELIEFVSRDVPRNVVGDKNRLRQVLVNLVANAIKFTEQGEISVRVSAEKLDSDDNYMVEIAVTDTGIGISEEDQARIFAPFTQVDSTSTRQHGGTGLGLSICQEIVGRMKGTLTVSSVPGTGSQFVFRVPLQREFKSTSLSSWVTADDFQGRRVLVVDDNATQGNSIIETLQNWEMDPVYAQTAEEAMTILNESDQNKTPCVDLILVDALMPGTDGLELLTLAEDEHVLPDAAVMMLSAADRKLFDLEEDSLPISAVLEKPVSQSNLMDVLVTIFSERIEPRKVSKKITKTKEKPLRVLFAEDTYANQRVVSEFLKRRGHEVVVANNGREAVDLVTSESFDIVLMDMQMPIMDGFQATKTIREQNADYSQVPILALTAHAMRGDRERCLAAGANEYLTKPIDAGELLTVIETLARKTGNEKGISPITPPPEQQIIEPSVRKESGIPGKVRREFEKSMNRLGDDAGLFAELSQMFVEDYPEYVTQINEAIQKKDYEAGQTVSHTLKGLVSNFGTETEACKQVLALEQHFYNQQDFDQAREILVEIQSSIATLSEQLKTYLKEIK